MLQTSLKLLPSLRLPRRAWLLSLVPNSHLSAPLEVLPHPYSESRLLQSLRCLRPDLLLQGGLHRLLPLHLLDSEV